MSDTWFFKFAALQTSDRLVMKQKQPKNHRVCSELYGFVQSKKQKLLKFQYHVDMYSPFHNSLVLHTQSQRDERTR